MNGSAESHMISMLVPVIEADRIGDLHGETCKALDRIGCPYELIYLVDGNQEEALGELREIQQAYPQRVRVFQFARDAGESSLLRAGVEQARGDILFTMPDRFSVDLAALADLYRAVTEGGCDLAFASRSRLDSTGGPHLQSEVFNRLISWASGTRFRDIASTTRAFKRAVVEETPLYGDFHRYLPILAMRLGFQVRECAAHLHPRTRKGPMHRPTVYLWRAMDVLTVMFVSRFTRYPLRLFGGIGSAFAGLGLLILIVIGIDRLFGTPLSNRPILVLATLLVGLGVQSFTIGLLGELILFFRARQVRDYRIAAVFESSPPPLEARPPIQRAE